MGIYRGIDGGDDVDVLVVSRGTRHIDDLPFP